MILIFGSIIASSFGGAPYVPMRSKAVRGLLGMGDLSSNDTVYDLGCGDGRILISAIKDFNAKKGVGYDIASWPIMKAKWLAKRAGVTDRIKLERRNCFDVGFGEATFIYMYLLPKLVNRLAPKISKEVKTGTKILCADFPINLEEHKQFQLLKTEKVGTITGYLYEKI
jgi:ribosomal protein L11 methylase PrmA